MRNRIEEVIKIFNLNRQRIFEVSKLTYAPIIKKIENNFVKHGGNIHWSNMGNGFHHNLKCTTEYIGENRLWFNWLPQIVPYPEQPVYALFEDSLQLNSKYWIYEMYLPELLCILCEVEGLDDFYIVSKKFDWLISECHEDIVSLIGENLDLSCFTK